MTPLVFFHVLQNATSHIIEHHELFLARAYANLHSTQTLKLVFNFLYI